MIRLSKINLETGMFIEDAILNGIPMILNWPTDAEGNPIQPEVAEGEETPPMYAPDPQYKPQPTQGADYTYWPKWDFETDRWVEGGTVPESVVPEPTLEERTAALEAAMLDLILGGDV